MICTSDENQTEGRDQRPVAQESRDYPEGSQAPQGPGSGTGEAVAA